MAEIRQGFPSLPVIAYCALTAEDTHSLIALVRAGADDVIVRDFDDVGAVASQVIARAAASRVGERAFAELSPFVSASVRPILAYCLSNPTGATAVDDIAHALGIARQPFQGLLQAIIGNISRSKTLSPGYRPVVRAREGAMLPFSKMTL